MQKTARILAISLMLLCFISFVTHALTLDVQMGFDHNQASVGWIPVWMEISSEELPFQGEIVLSTTHYNILRSQQRQEEYRIPLSIPAFSKRQYRAVVWYSGSPYQIRVEANDIVHWENQIQLDHKGQLANQVLVISDHGTGFEFLRQNELPTQVFYSQPRYLPVEWLGYQTIDTIIMHDADLHALSSAHVDAILNWLVPGKSLIWSGSGGYQSISSPLFRRLFPMEVRLKQTLTFSESENLTHPLLNSVNQLEIWQTQVEEAHIWLAYEQHPLVIHNHIGHGDVYFLAFDLEAPQLRIDQQRHWLFGELIAQKRWPRTATVSMDGLTAKILASGVWHGPSRYFLIIMIILLSCALIGLFYSIQVRKRNVLLLVFGLLVINGVSFLALLLVFNDTQRSVNRLMMDVAFIQKHPLSNRAIVEGYHTLIVTGVGDPEVTLRRTQGSITTLAPNADSLFNLLTTIVRPESVSIPLHTETEWGVAGFRTHYVAELPIFIDVAQSGELLRLKITNQSEFSVDQNYLHYEGKWYVLGPVLPYQEQFFIMERNRFGHSSLNAALPKIESLLVNRNSPDVLRQLLEETVLKELAANNYGDELWLMSVLQGNGFQQIVQLSGAGSREFYGFLLTPISLMLKE